jgi:hypothetical protein
MVPESSMMLALSSPISVPAPRPIPTPLPDPLGPISSEVMTPQPPLAPAHDCARLESFQIQDIIRKRTEKIKMHSEAANR